MLSLTLTHVILLNTVQLEGNDLKANIVHHLFRHKYYLLQHQYLIYYGIKQVKSDFLLMQWTIKSNIIIKTGS